MERQVERRAEAVLIAARIGRRTVVLLRRHEQWCSRSTSRCRAIDPSLVVRPGALLSGRARHGQTEVRHHHATIMASQDVRGLEVSMHDPDRVCCCEPATRLNERFHDFAP